MICALHPTSSVFASKFKVLLRGKRHATTSKRGSAHVKHRCSVKTANTHGYYLQQATEIRQWSGIRVDRTEFWPHEKSCLGLRLWVPVRCALHMHQISNVINMSLKDAREPPEVGSIARGLTAVGLRHAQLNRGRRLGRVHQVPNGANRETGELW
jgi:hypothetical protein